MELSKFKISRRTNLIEGVKLKESNNCLLFVSNPIDYTFDGFGVINKKYLKEENSINQDDIKYKILKIKKLPTNDELDNINLESIESLIEFFKEKKILIHLEFESDEYCFIGIVKETNEKSFLLNELTPKGKFLRNENFKYDKIRNIYIKTDYLDSFELYLKNENII